MNSKLTSKGQVTLPKALRDRLGLRTGDEIAFVEDGQGFRLEKKLDESPFDRWVGFLADDAGHDPDEMVEEMRGR